MSDVETLTQQIMDLARQEYPRDPQRFIHDLGYAVVEVVASCAVKDHEGAAVAEFSVMFTLLCESFITFNPSR